MAMRGLDPRQGFERARRTAKPHWIILASLLLIAAAEALAQPKPAIVHTASLESSTPVERRIVVSIPDRKLALVVDGRLAKVYRVAVGAPESPSPIGELRILSLIANPAYYYPGIVVPPGKSNPLGPRWIGLSEPGYGIHGTNQPRSVGHRASHGCIRMRNRDVVELFARVRVGDVVELHGTRDAETAQLFGTTPATPAAVATLLADAGSGER
jgi:lipoprotein-anchoring transpeptidase ErfK/SrfK